MPDGEPSHAGEVDPRFSHATARSPAGKEIPPSPRDGFLYSREGAPVRMASSRRKSRTEAQPPKGFRVSRDLPAGRHPLLAAFPGLDQLPAALRLQPDPVARAKLFDETCVQVVDQDL